MKGENMKKRKIIIDTDPGEDDALAIAMLLLNPSVEILGISTTFGNVSLEKTTANALRILDYFGKRDIPVIKGYSQPLIGKGLTAETFHGEDGLGNIFLPFSKRKPLEQNVIEFYRQTIMANENNIDLIALGPLTTIAKLFMMYPSIVSKINNLYIMGGTFKIPAVTLYEEFNFYNDPLAVKIVLNTPLNKYLVPLDITDRVYLNERQIKKLKAANTKSAELLYKISRFWKQNLSKKEQFIPWDCVGIGPFLKPELFKFRKVALDINLDKLRNKGKLIFRQKENRTTNLIIDVDVKRYLDFFNESLMRG